MTETPRTETPWTETPLPVDRQTPVKTLPSQTSFAGGNKYTQQRTIDFGSSWFNYRGSSEIGQFRDLNPDLSGFQSQDDTITQKDLTQKCGRITSTTTLIIGGSRGGREGRTPPPGRPNSFDFMQFSGKFGVFTPPLEGSRPPLGKILDPPLLILLLKTGDLCGVILSTRVLWPVHNPVSFQLNRPELYNRTNAIYYTQFFACFFLNMFLNNY